MEIRGLSAIEKYAASKPATDPGEGKGIAATAGRVIGDFATTLAQTEETAKTAMIGDADPHALVTALAQTELVVETAVSVRNKVVEAYQEILRMPV
ncbi:flagellar hook-basal body complex protein FliE [Sulfitobacter aestuariivivens]|uniref:Flagellar hook-basal body complex protein FliE n=1 Tax=Sulfitobacter aestuariivivens TaxID=2766981 RepID=A0A927D825_9RHOB|nr:flagellar hook-basal body complex protein FliE [Sulfitobacter aestuariivivens]MBD3665504.1 flagellar hook-basal body complex protein FliE [Sulfitobacter aestuariivivens]